MNRFLVILLSTGALLISGFTKPDEYILVKVSEQKLYLITSNTILREYPISTSKYGIGNKEGSGKTPLGKHRIVKKVGMGEPIGTVFRNLRKTGEIATIYYDSTDIESDLVITRVLVLEGLEKGVNKGRGIDSLSRGIYIHGTHEEGLIGKPASHGCIRMRNKDIMELFELVDIGTLVVIEN